jgi:hypothetical protein
MGTHGQDSTPNSPYLADFWRFSVVPDLLLRLLEVDTRRNTERAFPRVSRMRRIVTIGSVVALCLSLSGAMTPVVFAQAPAVSDQRADVPQATVAAAVVPTTPTPPVPPQTDGAPKPPLPIDLQHIKEQVEKQPAVKLDDQQLRFYVLVVGKEPKFNFNDFIGDYDLKNGPTKGGAAMTHQEFLDMVTPKALRELQGATSGSSFAIFQSALMNAGVQALIGKLRAARDDHERQAIRDQIDRELAALLGKEQ